MPEPVHVARARLFIDANVFNVFDPDVMEHPEADFPDFSATGLVGHSLSGPAIVCGTHLGEIDVTVEWWRRPPPALTADDWQDVAETGLAWTGSEMEVWGDGDEPLPVPIPGPGGYRLRVAGRHRDDGEDRGDDDPTETFLLQLWPGDGTGSVTLRTTSRVSAYWRESG